MSRTANTMACTMTTKSHSENVGYTFSMPNTRLATNATAHTARFTKRKRVVRRT